MSELSKLKVVELKERLRALDLSVSGKKADLVERLADAVVGDAAEAAEEAEARGGEGMCADCGKPLSDEAKERGHKYCPKCFKARRKVTGACAKCGKPLSAEAKERGHRYCPKCFKGQAGGKSSGGKGGTWVPRQGKVEDALRAVQGILSGIKKANTDRRTDTVRYDFAEADALFAKALGLYKAGKFGQVEVGEKVYSNIVDFLYQAVLGKANTIVAHGRLIDVERIIREGVERTEGLQGLIEDAIGLLDKGKAKDAADAAHAALRAVLRLRREAHEVEQAASREAFVARFEREAETQQEQRGRRGKRNSRGDDGPRNRRSEPYSRKKKKKRSRGPTLADVLS